MHIARKGEMKAYNTIIGKRGGGNQLEAIGKDRRIIIRNSGKI
jgi:hypothetical protein